MSVFPSRRLPAGADRGGPVASVPASFRSGSRCRRRRNQLSGISRLGSAPHLRVTRPLPGLSRRAPESGSRQHAWTVPQRTTGWNVRERNGSIPVDSSDNAARAGMPISIRPWSWDRTCCSRSCASRPQHRDRSSEPVRTVIATDFSHTKNVGWVFQPQINIDFRDTWLGRKAGPGLCSRATLRRPRYHNYFYGVRRITPRRNVRPSMPRADTPGARYSARSASASFLWVGAFAAGHAGRGGVRASPLCAAEDSFAAGSRSRGYLGNRRRWSRRKSECVCAGQLSKSLQERRQQPGTAGQDATMPQGSPDANSCGRRCVTLARPARLATNTSFYISATCTSLRVCRGLAVSTVLAPAPSCRFGVPLGRWMTACIFAASWHCSGPAGWCVSTWLRSIASRRTFDHHRAEHPCLLDAVFIISRLPQTACIMKAEYRLAFSSAGARDSRATFARRTD